jgi:pyruvate kinase
LAIAVSTSSERVRNQLNLSWGVIPFVLPACHSIEELIQRSFVYVKKQKLVKKGDEIIVVSGEPVGQAGHVNLLEVREVE